MKVLITLPASPSGPAYVAGAALYAGHTVEVFECLFARDLAGELKAHIARFEPDVIGVSIRLVHGFVIDEKAAFNTRHLDLRVRVRQVVDCIKQVSGAPIVLGGPGFNYYARDDQIRDAAGVRIMQETPQATRRFYPAACDVIGYCATGSQSANRSCT